MKYEVLSATATKAEYREAIAEVFGKDFLPVVECESSFVFYEKNGKIKRSPKNKNGTYDYTIYQLNDVHRGTAKRFGYEWDKLTFRQATELARYVMATEGKHAWVCSRKK